MFLDLILVEGPFWIYNNKGIMIDDRSVDVESDPNYLIIPNPF